MEVSAKNAWGKKNCLTPAFLAHTGFFFKISNYQCPLNNLSKKKKKNGGEKERAGPRIPFEGGIDLTILTKAISFAPTFLFTLFFLLRFVVSCPELVFFSLLLCLLCLLCLFCSNAQKKKRKYGRTLVSCAYSPLQTCGVFRKTRHKKRYHPPLNVLM